MLSILPKGVARAPVPWRAAASGPEVAKFFHSPLRTPILSAIKNLYQLIQIWLVVITEWTVSPMRREAMLMRTDPFRELDRLAQQVLGTTARPAAMPMDAWQEDKEFVVAFDLPGVNVDSVDLDIER